MRILIADDERDAADSFAELLRTGGYDVQAVYGGEEALEAARSFDPQVVMLDIEMPKISGDETARRLRARYDRKRLLLVAITGWTKPSDKILARLAGFDHHIGKPFDAESVLRFLSSVARQ